jgi:polar amino acid transport system ATP-binding protein
MSRQAAKAAAMAALSRVGWRKSDDWPVRLSGGQQQRQALPAHWR